MDKAIWTGDLDGLLGTRIIYHRVNHLKHKRFVKTATLLEHILASQLICENP